MNFVSVRKSASEIDRLSKMSDKKLKMLLQHADVFGHKNSAYSTNICNMAVFDISSLCTNVVHCVYIDKNIIPSIIPATRRHSLVQPSQQRSALD